jgi:hypothetical protein
MEDSENGTEEDEVDHDEEKDVREAVDETREPLPIRPGYDVDPAVISLQKRTLVGPSPEGELRDGEVDDDLVISMLTVPGNEETEVPPTLVVPVDPRDDQSPPISRY